MSKKSFVFIIFIIVIFVVVYGFYRYILYKEKIEYETVNYDSQTSWVKEVYNAHPSIFVFDSNGICKITVEQIHTMQNDIGNYIEHDKYGNMCIGYFIVKKNENNIEVDSSHICDMINY